MSEYLKFANRTAGKALGVTLAAVTFVAVAGIGVAQASSFPTLDTTTLKPSPLNPGDFTTVDTALANGGSLGAGFDIQIGVFVGDLSDSRFTGKFDFENAPGVNNFAAFRFWNPTEAQGGNLSTLAGAEARIHEIYFEKDLQAYMLDSLTVYGSDNTSFEGSTLRPSKPPGIRPVWGGTFAGLDRGRNSGSSNDDDIDDYHSKTFSGVGEGDWFELYVATTLDNTGALVKILGDGLRPGRIAMHIGDCDIKDSNYTYDSSDGSYKTSDGSRDHEYGKDHSDKKEYDDNDHEKRSGSSCVVDTWPPDPNVTAIPLPAAFPLYGTGLAVMGLLGWRKRRKAMAA